MGLLMTGEDGVVILEVATSFSRRCLGAIISFKEMLKSKNPNSVFEHEEEEKLRLKILKMRRECKFSKNYKSPIYRPHILASSLRQLFLQF